MGIGTGTVLALAGLVLALDAANLPGFVDRRLDSNWLGGVLLVVGIALIVLAAWANHRRHADDVV